MSLFAPLLEGTAVRFRESDPRESSAELGSLFPEEAERMKRAVEKRRKEYICGRTHARSLLREAGFPARAILHDENRAPIWPEGVRASITHTDSWCAVALGRADEVALVGLDVEKASPLKEALMDTICAPEDFEWLNAISDEETRGVMAKLVFSAKECAYKAQYAHSELYLGFQAMWIERLSSAAFRAHFRQDASPFRIGDTIDGSYRIENGLLATAVVQKRRK